MANRPMYSLKSIAKSKKLLSALIGRQAWVGAVPSAERESSHPLTMMMRWARRVRARKYTTRSLLGSLRFLKAGVCRVMVWGDGRGGGGTSRGRSTPVLGGGIPASAGRRRFKSASCVQSFVCSFPYTQLKPSELETLPAAKP